MPHGPSNRASLRLYQKWPNTNVARIEALYQNQWPGSARNRLYCGGLARFHWAFVNDAPPVEGTTRTSPCCAFERSPVDRRGCGRNLHYRVNI
jgi:hypothetical protein